MELVSPDFDNGANLPEICTCKGAGQSPQLTISGVPIAAQSLALFVHDPDAPGHDFVHWTMWNISATTALLLPGRVPAGAIQGKNDFGKLGYGAPCPPNDTHRYVFELYALNRQLDLAEGAHSFALIPLLQEHALAHAKLIGLASAAD